MPWRCISARALASRASRSAAADRRRQRDRHELGQRLRPAAPSRRAATRPLPAAPPAAKHRAAADRECHHRRSPVSTAATVARRGRIAPAARAMFDSKPHTDRRQAPPGTARNDRLLAGLMALNAFAIDAMIPALAGDRRGRSASPRKTDRQLVVVAYLLGFGSTQLIWGPLADRFGRKPVLAAGIALYAAVRPAVRHRRQLRAADRRAGGDGRVGGGHPRAGRGDGPRPVRRRGDGAGHEPGVHGLHGRAGARAERRPGRSCWSRRGGRSSSCSPPTALIDAGLVVDPAARDAASRISPLARPGARSAARRGQTVREPQSRGYTLALTVTFGGADRLHRLDPADRVRRLRARRS